MLRISAISRRLKSAFIASAAAVLLLLFLITCVAWVRGYWVQDGVVRNYAKIIEPELDPNLIPQIPWKYRQRFTVGCGYVNDYTVVSMGGRIEVIHRYNQGPMMHVTVDEPPVWDWSSIPLTLQSGSWRVNWGDLWFSGWIHPLTSARVPWLNGPNDPLEYGGGFDVWIPDWVFALATGLPGVLLLLRLRSRSWRRRRAAGLCTTCGYDLRSSRTRCPECGEFIPDASTCPRAVPSSKPLVSGLPRGSTGHAGGGNGRLTRCLSGRSGSNAVSGDRLAGSTDGGSALEG